VDDWKVLDDDAVDVAQRLLGCILTREIDGEQVTVKIVETEAYHQTDAASHSYKGRTERTSIMFGPSGYVYVYFTYGMHYCMNVVTGLEGEGSAVLIRAVEPLTGIEILRRHRPPNTHDLQLTNGPAKLCQALGIDKQLNAHNLRESPLQLELKPPISEDQIVQTTRVGITRDVDRLWRFYIRKNPFVSKP
jgi:DNA-3-methyladenine glycosylase